MNKLTQKMAICLLGTMVSFASYADGLDSDDATVSMTVGLYASLTGLDNFILQTSDNSGAASAVYSGSDDFNLESNGQVRVSLDGDDLENGADSVSTSYALDDNGITFDTASGEKHDASHSVSAEATLDEISSQQEGEYSAVITLTVSAI